jgi:hypothetical protein
MFDAKTGLKEKFKKQSRLLSSIDSYTQNELETLYKTLNIQANYPKNEFIELVEQRTKNIF